MMSQKLRMVRRFGLVMVCFHIEIYLCATKVHKITGITNGIVGYAVGNYIGFIIYQILT